MTAATAGAICRFQLPVDIQTSRQSSPAEGGMAEAVCWTLADVSDAGAVPLLDASDGVRDVGLFQVGDLAGVELDVDRSDRI
jgi:hypothetical protein